MDVHLILVACTLILTFWEFVLQLHMCFENMSAGSHLIYCTFFLIVIDQFCKIVEKKFKLIYPLNEFWLKLYRWLTIDHLLITYLCGKLNIFQLKSTFHKNTFFRSLCLRLKSLYTFITLFLAKLLCLSFPPSLNLTQSVTGVFSLWCNYCGTGLP